MSDPPAQRRRHLLISGTGRSGTSFLVRYLTGLGLDTTLARHGAGAAWDEHANAGLEELPVADAANWPYVVKTPWLHQLVDQLLADGSVTIDAVIMPMRPLMEVAASRVILELRALHAANPWLAANERPWTEAWATAGGCLIPLEPLDQARLLAVGFFNLVERLVRAGIPLVFLAFPRLAEDADYLFASLSSLLPGVSAAQACEVHASLANPALVRVGGELRPVATGGGTGAPETGAPETGAPELATLDGIALRRELIRIRTQLAESDAVTRAAGEQVRDLLERNQALSDELARVGKAHQAVLDSTSWRITRPMRGFRHLWAPRSK